MGTQLLMFHEAMRALLGSHDMVCGFRRLFAVLCEHMPLEALAFDRYDAAGRALIIEDLVTHEGYFNVRLRVPLSQQGVDYVESNQGKQLVMHLAHEFYLKLIPPEHALALERHVSFRHRDYMAGTLHMDGGFMGALVCIGKEKAVFSKHHAQLLENLLPACAMTIHNIQRIADMNQRHARLVKEQGSLRRELAVVTEWGMVGSQGGLRDVLDNVRRLSNKDTPVLITGETGTGKELVANAIQRLSPRADKPFIKVNCGALTDSLVDSELFGHEKGAFTGASRQRMGRFEQADSGTLFLDEVGELSPQAQVRLLRVLQDGLVERIGSERPTFVDVRIIAATHRDLAAMCREGTFREDLFHRLNVFPIPVPPLRKRREDLALLVRHFAKHIALRLGMPMPVVKMENMDRLMQYAWPGNVRELENLVERALILSQGGDIDLASLLPAPVAATLRHPTESSMMSRMAGETLDPPAPLGTPAFPNSLGLAATGPLENGTSAMHGEALDEIRIREALARCQGRVYGPQGAAALLGMNHNTLYSRLRKWGVRTRRVWES